MAKTIWARFIDWLEEIFPTNRNNRSALMEDLARAYQDAERLRKEIKDIQRRHEATLGWELEEAKADAARYKKWWIEKERECRRLHDELTELKMTPEERAERDQRLEFERQRKEAEAKAREQGRLDAIRRNEAAKHLTLEARRNPVAPTAGQNRPAPGAKAPSGSRFDYAQPMSSHNSGHMVLDGTTPRFIYDDPNAMTIAPAADVVGDVAQAVETAVESVADFVAEHTPSFGEVVERVEEAADAGFWGSDPTPASDVGQAAESSFAFQEPAPSYTPDPSPSYDSGAAASSSFDSGSSSSFDSGSSGGGGSDW